MAPARTGALRRAPRGLVGALALTAPGLALRIGGARPAPWVAAILLGLAVVGAAFILAWAAELVQLDVSQGLALAALALVAVMPEYAVDSLTWKAATIPTHEALALATYGREPAPHGVGWPLVVLLTRGRCDGPRGGRARGAGRLHRRLDRRHAWRSGFLGAARSTP